MQIVFKDSYIMGKWNSRKQEWEQKTGMETRKICWKLAKIAANNQFPPCFFDN